MMWASLLLLVAWLLAAPVFLAAQGNYNPRDDQYRVLGLVRAKSQYDQAATALQRAKRLHGEEVISTAELDQTHAAWERARVDYMQQALAVASAAPHVSIERVLKSRTPDGRNLVRLTLRNTTGGGAEDAQLSRLLDREMLSQLRAGPITNVYVSLKSEPGPPGTIISQPYERKIPALRAGQAATVAFHLLRDMDELVVAVGYAGTVEERKVFLEKDASANIVAVQSAQFSQETDLGGQATYDLRLERFTSDDNVFRLDVLGLPQGVRHEFRDPETGARLGQIRFPEGQSQKNLQLVVSLPQRTTGAFRTDEPIRFWTLALDEAAAAQLQQMSAGPTPVGAEAMAELRAGKTPLELVPRGVGRIQVRAVNLYHEIAPGDSVVMEVVMRNSGSRSLDNVRLRVDAPLGWQTRTSPELIPDLPTDVEQTVTVFLIPPREVPVGDYEARLKTESAGADRRIETEDKTVRIHVGSATNWVGTGALALLLLGLVGGVVAAGVRLAKR
jgi:hypothetical protein